MGRGWEVCWHSKGRHTLNTRKYSTLLNNLNSTIVITKFIKMPWPFFTLRQNSSREVIQTSPFRTISSKTLKSCQLHVDFTSLICCWPCIFRISILHLLGEALLFKVTSLQVGCWNYYWYVCFQICFIHMETSQLPLTVFKFWPILGTYDHSFACHTYCDTSHPFIQ